MLGLVLVERDSVEVAEEVVQILGSLLVAQPVMLVAAQQRLGCLTAQTL